MEPPSEQKWNRLRCGTFCQPAACFLDRADLHGQHIVNRRNLDSERVGRPFIGCKTCAGRSRSGKDQERLCFRRKPCHIDFNSTVTTAQNGQDQQSRDIQLLTRWFMTYLFKLTMAPLGPTAHICEVPIPKDPASRRRSNRRASICPSKTEDGIWSLADDPDIIGDRFPDSGKDGYFGAHGCGSAALNHKAAALTARNNSTCSHHPDIILDRIPDR